MRRPERRRRRRRSRGRSTFQAPSASVNSLNDRACRIRSCAPRRDPSPRARKHLSRTSRQRRVRRTGQQVGLGLRRDRQPRPRSLRPSPPTTSRPRSALRGRRELRDLLRRLQLAPAPRSPTSPRSRPADRPPTGTRPASTAPASSTRRPTTTSSTAARRSTDLERRNTDRSPHTTAPHQDRSSRPTPRRTRRSRAHPPQECESKPR